MARLLQQMLDGRGLRGQALQRRSDKIRAGAALILGEPGVLRLGDVFRADLPDDPLDRVIRRGGRRLAGGAEEKLRDLAREEGAEDLVFVRRLRADGVELLDLLVGEIIAEILRGIL
jgi:hypothetical protein